MLGPNASAIHASKVCHQSHMSSKRQKEPLHFLYLTTLLESIMALSLLLLLVVLLL